MPGPDKKEQIPQVISTCCSTWHYCFSLLDSIPPQSAETAAHPVYALQRGVTLYDSILLQSGFMTFVCSHDSNHPFVAIDGRVLRLLLCQTLFLAHPEKMTPLLRPCPPGDSNASCDLVIY